VKIFMDFFVIKHVSIIQAFASRCAKTSAKLLL
jgi:hypothetical protein